MRFFRLRFERLFTAPCSSCISPTSNWSPRRTQIDRQNARLAEIRKLRRQWVTMLSTGSRHLMQHMAEQCRLDLRWLRAVLADVETGGIRHTPDPARLAAKI
jgi:hypothetical protein